MIELSTLIFCASLFAQVPSPETEPEKEIESLIDSEVGYIDEDSFWDYLQTKRRALNLKVRPMPHPGSTAITPAIELFPFRIHGFYRVGSSALGPASRRASTWRGGQESGTGRLLIDALNWQGGFIIDKDAYEPKWNDLQRLFVHRQTDHSTVVFGDYCLSTGEGLALGTHPEFPQSISSPVLSLPTKVRLDPATNTQVNRYLRGIACSWREVDQSILLFAADTPYDAIRSDSGDLISLSDGGLHRSRAEARKFGSLQEKGAGGAISRMTKISGYQLTVGLTGWIGKFNKPLKPDVDGSDPFPLKGDRSGALGMSLGVERDDLLGSGELAFDEEGFPAGVVNLSHRSRSGLRWLSGAIYAASDRYNNLHSAGLFGVEAKGVRSASIAVAQSILHSSIKTVRLGAGVQERLVSGASDQFRRLKTRLDSEIEGEFDPFTWLTRYTLSDIEEECIGGENTRDQTLKISLSRNTTSGGTMEWWSQGALHTGDESGLWDATGWASGLRYRYRSGSNRYAVIPSRSSCGFQFYSTSRHQPIYLGEFYHPNYPALIRMSGKGIRCSGEVFWSLFNDRTSSATTSLQVGFKGAVVLPAGSGEGTKEELYFTLIWK